MERGGANASSSSAERTSYQALMQREQRVLDSLDRIVNERENTTRAGFSIMGMSISQHALRCVGMMRGLMDDLTAARKVSDVTRAFLREDRQLYLGALLMMLAVFIALMAA